MSKEILRIYRDKSGEIIYEFHDNDEVYEAGSSWKDVLNDVRESSLKTATFKNGNAYFSYEGLTLRLDNYVDLLNEELMDYLGPSVLKSIHKRVKDLENKIASRMNPNHKEEPRTTEIKPTRTPIKCKRKNKYSSLKTKVIVGGLILAVLTTGAIITLDNDSKAVVEESETTRIEATYDADMDIGIPRFAFSDFKTDLTLDINDFDQGRLEKVIPYENNVDSEQMNNVIDNYGEQIKAQAERCGIDPQIMYAVAAQESAGKHEYGLTRGSGGGLFQIEMNTWEGKTISYYDLKEKVEKEIKVTDDMVKDPEKCIEIACALMQDSLNRYRTIPLAIQEYNMGYYNLKPVLQAASQDLGVTNFELYKDETCPWKDYMFAAKGGDKEYLQKVLSFAGFGYNTEEFVCTLTNGQTISCSADAMFKTSTPVDEDNKVR